MTVLQRVVLDEIHRPPNPAELLKRGISGDRSLTKDDLVNPDL
jgi:hypothetical protein